MLAFIPIQGEEFQYPYSDWSIFRKEGVRSHQPFVEGNWGNFPWILMGRQRCALTMMLNPATKRDEGGSFSCFKHRSPPSSVSNLRRARS